MEMPWYELLQSKAAHFAIEHLDDNMYAPFSGANFTAKQVSAYVVFVQKNENATHIYIMP
jgi:hypothetical protein